MVYTTEQKIKAILQHSQKESDLLLEPQPNPQSPRMPAAVLIPILADEHNEHVILTKRSEHLRHHPGQVSFPGGRLEHTDDSPLACALRETQEELGVESDKIHVLGEMGQWQSYSGFDVSVFIGMVHGPVQYMPCPREVAAVIEVPTKHAFNPEHYEQVHYTVNNQSRHFFQTHFAGERIWGFTGSLMYLMSQYLKHL